MDIKHIRKKLQISDNSDKQNTVDQQLIAKKGINEALRYRERRLKEIESDKNRIENFQEKVKAYNEKKFKEYNEVLEALRKTNENYYNYYKKYEKEHGWKKATRVLEKHNLMKQWINFNIPIFKYVPKVTTKPPTPGKISPPEPLPQPPEPSLESKPPIKPQKIESIVDNELGKKFEVESYYDEIFTPEEQYINEEKILENLERNIDMSYIKFRMLRAGFSEHDVVRVAEKLTPEERIQVADRLQKETPMDDESDLYITTSPPHGQYSDEWANEMLNKEYMTISDILADYEVWW